MQIHHTPARKVGVWILFLLLSTTTHAQHERVYLPRTQLRTEEIIRTVQQQTDYVFAFDRRTFDISRTVRVGATEQSVRELLELITAGTDCTWLQSDSYIVIHYRPRPQAPSSEPEPEPESAPRTNDTYRLSDPDVADAFRSRELQSAEPVPSTSRLRPRYPSDRPPLRPFPPPSRPTVTPICTPLSGTTCRGARSRRICFTAPVR